MFCPSLFIFLYNDIVIRQDRQVYRIFIKRRRRKIPFLGSGVYNEERELRLPFFRFETKLKE